MKSNTIISLLILLFIIGVPSSVFAEEKAHGHHSKSYFIGLDSAPAKVVSQFHKALGAKNQEVARGLLDDNVLIYEGGRAERSASEYAQHHMMADMAFLSSVDVQTLEHQVKVYGDLAVSSARTKTKGTYKGKKINSNGMETIVLRKIKGDWKIINIHWSN